MSEKRQVDDALIELLRTADEATLRELDMPWPRTMKELDRIINALAERQHDYGTCVYAMSIAAEAAYNFIAGALGVTGFQASCADMDVLRRTRNLKHGFRLLDYGKLLYPQYLTDEHFPGWQILMWDKEIRERLRDEAKKQLAEMPGAHPDVKAHWDMLAAYETKP